MYQLPQGKKTFGPTTTVTAAQQVRAWMTNTTSWAILFRMKGGMFVGSAAPAPRTQDSNVCLICEAPSMGLFSSGFRAGSTDSSHVIRPQRSGLSIRL